MAHTVNPIPLSSESRWFLGPSFLRENETRWPNNDLETKYTDENVLELKQNSQNSHTVCSIVETPLEINFTRFSSWTHLLATVTRVFEAIYIWKKTIYTPSIK